jgi:hypothetical protein
MARCGRIKGDGERCKGIAIPGAEWCYAHHPDYQEERRRSASKAGKRGGRGRGSGELAIIKALLSDLSERVLSGELQPGPAAVANQLINTRLRAVELERKLRETEELEDRLEALEQAQERKGGTRGWG